MRRSNKKSKKKIATLSITDGVRRLVLQTGSQLGLHGKPLWSLVVVPVQYAAESAIVGSWNSKMLRFCEGVGILENVTRVTAHDKRKASEV
jgi:hypothetical protein